MMRGTLEIKAVIENNDLNCYNIIIERSKNCSLGDLLRSIGKNKEALEVVMAAKELENKKILVNEIILKEPELKSYVNELSVKYKISLE